MDTLESVRERPPRTALESPQRRLSVLDPALRQQRHSRALNAPFSLRVFSRTPESSRKKYCDGRDSTYKLPSLDTPWQIKGSPKVWLSAVPRCCTASPPPRCALAEAMQLGLQAESWPCTVFMSGRFSRFSLQQLTINCHSWSWSSNPNHVVFGGRGGRWPPTTRNMMRP